MTPRSGTDGPIDHDASHRDTSRGSFGSVKLVCVARVATRNTICQRPQCGGLPYGGGASASSYSRPSDLHVLGLFPERQRRRWASNRPRGAQFALAPWMREAAVDCEERSWDNKRPYARLDRACLKPTPTMFSRQIGTLSDASLRVCPTGNVGTSVRVRRNYCRAGFPRPRYVHQPQ